MKTENRNERGFYEYQYPRPALTADVVLFSNDPTEVLLIQRGNEPYKSCWAFPGGFMEIDETLEQCAIRELKEETGLEIEIGELHEIGTFSTIGRDPRGRVITSAYYTCVEKSSVNPIANDDATQTKWFKINNLPNLAFDHKEILDKTLNLLKL